MGPDRWLPLGGRKANTLIDEAIAALAPLGEQAAPLAGLAHYMIERDH